ncbi:hypothetical protein [Salinarimonas ramus]|uniref:3-phosphoshikimate 1-carboxyvinyltransferase n=1 Tax=Salinarimonas ramus TaxID=690164 RepID=A0A917V3F9_9HYPH|nr:hypothetical protein [Salinarimonas ramus]GGK31832.1 3-phosphoshikimate 1-carboxyvinyltransferase [Salinarimonas ramus]
MPHAPASEDASTLLTVRPSGGLRGRLRVPASAALAHRALVVGLLSIGETVIEGVGETRAEIAALARTARACAALGARVEMCGEGRVAVAGVGIGGLVAPREALVVDRIALAPLLGACAGHPIASRFAAAAPLPEGLAEALTRQGARLVRGGADLLVEGSREVIPIVVDGSADAATLAAVLLAGLNGPGRTTIVEPAATGDAMASLLARAGATIRVTPQGEAGRSIALDGWPELVGRPLALPADPARAAALALGAIVVPGSDIVLDGLDRDGPAGALVASLRAMGAAIADEPSAIADLASLRVRAGALSGAVVAAEIVRALGPALPALVLAAACAAGESRLAGIARRADASRVAALGAALAGLGVAHHVAGEDLVIEGAGGDVARPPRGGARIDAGGDPALAAGLAALGAAAEPDGLAIDNVGDDDDLPGFVAQLRALGADVEECARWAS